MSEKNLILTINFGSTSSKMAVYENEKELCRYETTHERDTLGPIKEQKEMRKNAVLHLLEENNILLTDLTAISARAGVLPPLNAGAYKINENMVDFLVNRPIAEHAANLCAVIAYEIAQEQGIPAYIYDSGTTDQMNEIARISGIPEIKRKSLGHFENMRAVAFKVADKLGCSLNELNLVVAHLGGGITMGVFEQGRVVDLISDDDGPFSPERSGGLPSSWLAQMFLSGKYDEKEIFSKIRGKGGLLAYLGTADAREVEKRILDGDEYAELIYKAMAYQVAKGIGQLATVVKGNVRRIVLTGGIAHSKMFTEWVTEAVEFIADVDIYPGENELEALAHGVLRVIRGSESAQTFCD